MDISNTTTNFNTASVAGSETQTPKTKEVLRQKVESTEPKTTTELNKQNEEEAKEKLNSVVKRLNAQMDMLNTNIKFGFSDDIEAMYIKVQEKDSGKLIRKFPTDEAMKLAKHMKEFIGILFDKKG